MSGSLYMESRIQCGLQNSGTPKTIPNAEHTREPIPHVPGKTLFQEKVHFATGASAPVSHELDSIVHSLSLRNFDPSLKGT